MRKSPREFCMEHMWLHHPKFKDALQTSLIGAYMGENITEKIQRCGAELMQWANGEFGSVKRKERSL